MYRFSDSETFILLAPTNRAFENTKLQTFNAMYHVIPLGNGPAPMVSDDSTFTTLSGVVTLTFTTLTIT